MPALLRIADDIDRLNRAVGRSVMWLTVAMVIVQAAVVLLRYVFAVGFVPMQESVWTMHGLVFLLGAGFTLSKNGHVRVDVFYRDARQRTRALIDILGALLLLLPFCVVTLILSWPYVATSWRVFEGSREVGGLPGLFLVKTVLLVFAGLLGLQAIALAIRGFDRFRNASKPNP